MIRTFLDAGVFIAASKAKPSPTDARYRDRTANFHRDRAEWAGAWKTLGERSRVFVSSPFIDLEVLPPVEAERRFHDELAVRLQLLRECSPVDATLEDIYRKARELGRESGISGIDALHLAAAHLGNCAELITSESRGHLFKSNDARPLRVRVIDVRSLAPPSVAAPIPTEDDVAPLKPKRPITSEEINELIRKDRKRGE
ncbi:MAG: type II toxin-antitoxin system VapC family toxin [Elusimicrobiota bacterium]|jgi:predicted nucleic acid-binding protein